MAPSTFNEQEWRFLYARRDSPHWPAFFGLLKEANQTWCARGAVLMVVLSHRVFTSDGRPNPVHTFDAGAAFENLALQGAAMGLVVHGMAGFDRGQARATLGVPDDYAVEAMIAVGHPGDPAELPPQLRARRSPPAANPSARSLARGRSRSSPSGSRHWSFGDEETMLIEAYPDPFSDGGARTSIVRTLRGDLHRPHVVLGVDRNTRLEVVGEPLEGLHDPCTSRR